MSTLGSPDQTLNTAKTSVRSRVHGLVPTGSSRDGLLRQHALALAVHLVQPPHKRIVAPDCERLHDHRKALKVEQAGGGLAVQVD